MVENLIRKWLRGRQTSKPKLTPKIIVNPDPTKRIKAYAILG